jgi:hypothetical protein
MAYKVYQMIIKDIEIIRSKCFPNVPKLGVWFENKPPGNPGGHLNIMNLNKHLHIGT